MRYLKANFPILNLKMSLPARQMSLEEVTHANFPLILMGLYIVSAQSPAYLSGQSLGVRPPKIFHMIGDTAKRNVPLKVSMTLNCTHT